jgi:hypothetical protein
MLQALSSSDAQRAPRNCFRLRFLTRNEAHLIELPSDVQQVVSASCKTQNKTGA